MDNKRGLPPPYNATEAGSYAPPHVYPNSHLPQHSQQSPHVTAPIYLQQPQLPPPPQQHTVIVSHAIGLGRVPTSIICPSCHAQITTTVETISNTKTHLFALVLCLFGFWPCCCIPYCTDTCQTQNHYCPNCKAYLGNYSN